jgi:hypothetical protein
MKTSLRIYFPVMRKLRPSNVLVQSSAPVSAVMVIIQNPDNLTPAKRQNLSFFVEDGIIDLGRKWSARILRAVGESVRLRNYVRRNKNQKSRFRPQVRGIVKSLARCVVMIEQEKAGRTRIWGYALGIVAFVVVAVWKFATR